MTLVQLGEFLRVSNAERNCLHAKIFSYKRKVENQAALKKTKDKCLYAKERALAAKARAQNLNKKADTIRRSEMEMLQKTAAMRIALSTREAKRRIRDRQEQDAIFEAIGKKPIGVTSASPIKSPSQIRHTLTGTLTRIKSPSPTRGVRGDAPQTSPSSFFPPI